MKLLKILGTLLSFAIVVVLGLAMAQPDVFAVQRSTVIQAPPEKVYAILEDFDRAKEWSPFEKKDPNLKRSRSGPPKGKGAVYAFEGNKEVGSGSLTVVDTAAPNKMVIRLDMTEPMKASDTVEYNLAPEGPGNNGLASLKALAEK